jgi:hypothetical protein
MWTVVWWFLAGCGSDAGGRAVPIDAGAFAVGAAAPPTAALLDPGFPLADYPSEVWVRVPGAGAGHRVYLAYSNSTPGSSSCAPGLPACFGLRRAIEVARGTTDASGAARLWWLPPAQERSGTVQAMVVASTGQHLLTAAVPITFGASALDFDDDGLEHTWEVARGLDPGLADSDGGGVSDSQELLLDTTDPLDPADDIPGERACENGLDDDLDGDSDCIDPDCLPYPTCAEWSCADGEDDDEDGLVDCADPDCALAAACGEADCDDGADDDGDGLADCDDDDCWTAACHAEVVSWIDQGTATLTSRGPGLRSWDSGTNLRGGVWVDGPWGPHLCRWTFGALGGPDLATDPACRLTDGIVPAAASLTLDPSQSLRDAAGDVWLGPGVISPSSSSVRWRYDVLDHQPPRGTCAGGAAPIQAFLDDDGDGYGQDGVDLYGLDRGPVWVCDATFPGIALQAGDCDDNDPTWNPAAVTVAPGATCGHLRWDDRDGDGVNKWDDSDDRDGGTP